MSLSPSPARRTAATITALVLATAALSSGGAADAGKPGGGGKRAKASFDQTSYVVGQGAVAVHGTVPGGRRKVQLQVRTKGGYATIAKTRTAKDDTFAISDPLTWYGRHKVRVLAEGRNGLTKQKSVSISPGYVPVGDRRDSVLLDSALRWNPCGTVTYAVNTAEVGPEYLPLVQQAMSQVSAATGIPVAYKGTSTMVPASYLDRTKKLPKGIDLVVAFGNNSEVQEFASGVADGLAGARRERVGRSTSGKRVYEILEAGVTLQTEGVLTNYVPTFESPASGGKPGVGNLLLHEIGHAFGLDHSHLPDEMMAAAAWQPDADGVYRSRYAAGDLTGLKKVGLAQGCVVPARGRARGHAPTAARRAVAHAAFAARP